MPNYLAIDAHPLPAGEARMSRLQEDVANIVWKVNNMEGSMVDLSSKFDKR